MSKVSKVKELEKQLVSDKKPVTVCVDVMGGDVGPEPIFEGIFKALLEKPNLNVLVAGDPALIDPVCAEYARIHPLPCTQSIAMDEHPAEAVRTKKDSSIVKGCKAVNKGDADAFFSAGSTGAILAAATLNVGRIKGISRPALATVLPGKAGNETIFLDLGANADLRCELYPQLALMGSAFYRTLIKEKVCRVALLSNGSEDTKGSEHAQAAFAVLRESDQQKNASYTFVGNAEGNDLLMGTHDVIVSSGFEGNIALKAMEGAVKYAVDFLKANLKRSPLRALGLLLCRFRLKRLAYDLSGEAYGGAVLLGLRNPVLVGHGKTSSEAVRSGILAACDMVESGLCEQVEKELEQTGSPAETSKTK